MSAEGQRYYTQGRLDGCPAAHATCIPKHSWRAQGGGRGSRRQLHARPLAIRGEPTTPAGRQARFLCSLHTAGMRKGQPLDPGMCVAPELRGPRVLRTAWATCKKSTRHSMWCAAPASGPACICPLRRQGAEHGARAVLQTCSQPRLGCRRLMHVYPAKQRHVLTDTHACMHCFASLPQVRLLRLPRGAWGNNRPAISTPVTGCTGACACAGLTACFLMAC